MGLLDKVKGMLGGGKGQSAKDAVDKAATAVESKTPDNVDKMVEKGAQEVKNVIDKVEGS
jgi:hypothetical protein